MIEHKREERPREIVEYFCADVDCEFYGQPAQQGVCHTADPEIGQWDKLYDIAEKFAADLKEFRTQHITDDGSPASHEEYISWLESMYECTSLNWMFTLDECIRLRRDVARLKLKITKLEGA